MSVVLLYNIPSAKLAKMRVLFLRAGIKMRVVPESEYSYTVGSLLDASPVCAETSEIHPFTDEMLVFCSFSEKQLDSVLSGLRQMHIGVALKAVLTDTNRTWSSIQLHDEIAKERIAMQQQKSPAHK